MGECVKTWKAENKTFFSCIADDFMVFILTPFHMPSNVAVCESVAHSSVVFPNTHKKRRGKTKTTPFVCACVCKMGKIPLFALSLSLAHLP